MTLTGKVKWFNATKGFGFLEAEDGTEAFAHFSQIVGTGYKSLEEGEAVRFTVVNTDKGPQAENIEKI